MELLEGVELMKLIEFSCSTDEGVEAERGHPVSKVQTPGLYRLTPTARVQCPNPSPRTLVLTSQRMAEGGDRAVHPQAPPTPQHRLQGPPGTCLGRHGLAGLPEGISGSPPWAGWQWLSVMPAGPKEALMWHKYPSSTPAHCR